MQRPPHPSWAVTTRRIPALGGPPRRGHQPRHGCHPLRVGGATPRGTSQDPPNGRTG